MLDIGIQQRLARIVGKENALFSETQLMVYDYDASVDKERAGGVVLPGSKEEVV